MYHFQFKKIKINYQAFKPSYNTKKNVIFIEYIPIK